MNKKGFTLVELLATLVILGIVVGLTIVGMKYNLNKTKEKTEEVFIGTIKDAIKMYLDSDAKKLKYDIEVCTISKALNDSVKVYKANSIVTMSDIIGSKYSPLLKSDFVNPNNKEKQCKMGASVSIYRDDDFVYYYEIKKSELECLTLDKDGYITNLPKGCNG